MASAFTIEKNVAQPTSHARQTYPFDDMEVGDSFFVAGSSMEERQRVQNAAYANGSRKGVRFSTRKVDGGYRVWRIA